MNSTQFMSGLLAFMCVLAMPLYGQAVSKADVDAFIEELRNVRQVLQTKPFEIYCKDGGNIRKLNRCFETARGKLRQFVREQQDYIRQEGGKYLIDSLDDDAFRKLGITREVIRPYFNAEILDTWTFDESWSKETRIFSSKIHVRLKVVVDEHFQRMLIATVVDPLVRQAERYVKSRGYIYPEGRNAFDVCQMILEIQPDHQRAREILHDIMRKYRRWGDEKLKEGIYEEAGDYYKRYLQVAEYCFEMLNEQELHSEIRRVKSQLYKANHPPTPTPVSTSTPKRISTQTPSVTAIPKARRTPTPKPVHHRFLDYTVPSGAGSREVSITVKNEQGSRRFYHKQLSAGQEVSVAIPVVGKTVVEIYLDGTLDQVRRYEYE